MLRLLRVRNFALMDELSLEFDRGLNVISGETGAGKSLIVDALALLAGAKATSDVIRGGENRAVIEAVFQHPPSLDLDQFGLDSEDELVLRREISADNRNRVFINSQPSTVSALREIAPTLLDIHGQHEQQTLLSPANQLELIDRAAGVEEIRHRVSTLFAQIRSLKEELETLERDETEIRERTDFLEFQRDEISRAETQSGETEKLRDGLRILQNSEKLMEAAARSYQSLYESDGSILSELAPIERAIGEAQLHDDRLASVSQQLVAARAALEDASYALRDYLSQLDTDPGKLERIQTRLAELERLHRKYGRDLIAHLEKVIQALDKLGLTENRKSFVTEELESLTAEYTEAANALSSRRHACSPKLEHTVEAEVRSLAMPEAVFSIKWTRLDRGRATGIDRPDFLLAPNPGEDSGLLSEMASGGEISRTMLALRTVMAADKDEKTLVFDEIDAGIGGEAAETVGRKLHDLSDSYQVLSVTHLSQIARFADHHCRIQKVQLGGRTVVRVEALDEKGRVEELARMMSGRRVTDTARRHVRELLRGQ